MDARDRAIRVFEEAGGSLKTAEALRQGVTRHVLYGLLEDGRIERISRGLYRLASLPDLTQPDLAAVCLRSRQGVICLISALAYHEFGTQIPRAIDLALPRGAEPPRIEHPPVHVYWFSGRAYSEGVETHAVDGVQLRIYCAEKTIADVFKYRNKLGLDLALEALRDWARRPGREVEELRRYARICRVEKIMRPYLEAVL